MITLVIKYQKKHIVYIAYVHTLIYPRQSNNVSAFSETRWCLRLVESSWLERFCGMGWSRYTQGEPQRGRIWWFNGVVMVIIYGDLMVI